MNLLVFATQIATKCLTPLRKGLLQRNETFSVAFDLCLIKEKSRSEILGEVQEDNVKRD